MMRFTPWHCRRDCPWPRHGEYGQAHVAVPAWPSQVTDLASTPSFHPGRALRYTWFATANSSAQLMERPVRLAAPAPVVYEWLTGMFLWISHVARKYVVDTLPCLALFQAAGSKQPALLECVLPYGGSVLRLAPPVSELQRDGWMIPLNACF